MMRQIDWEESHGMVNYERIDDVVQSRNKDFQDAVADVGKFDIWFLRNSTMELLGRRTINSTTVILTFCCTQYGSLAFILSEGSPLDIRSVDVPEFSRKDLIDLITRMPDEDGFAREGWLGSLTPYLKDRTPINFAIWRNQIETTLEQLGRGLFWPVLKHLGNQIDSLVIVPSHELYVLPLQAVPLEGESTISVIDRYDVRFAPSLEMLAHCELHADGRSSEPFLGVTNPQEDSVLMFTEFEGRTAASQFGLATVLHGGQATRETVVRKLSGAGTVHFACHGIFDWRTPRNSGLVMSDGLLTVDELLLGEITLNDEQKGAQHTFVCVPMDLSHLRLVTLSSCESGVSDVLHGSPAEYLAISSGFLLAGLPSVISTLWPVHDFTTALFMKQFYERFATGDSVPKSVAFASRWLKHVTAGELAEYFRLDDQSDSRAASIPMGIRTSLRRRFASMDPVSKPYKHPYFWAGIAANGV
jgi:CHAT domain-containing protein